MIDAARPRLHATHSWEEAVRGAEASFIIVPTPSEDGDGFTNRYVLDAVTRIGAALRGSGRYHVVNITSTVMPGSTDGPIRAALEKPYAGAVLGNPSGHRVLVEFLDFACGYCRRSVADIAQLTAANPNLRVVVHDLPILTPESRDAAKMALAAARQGRYAAFYAAMFGIGRPDAGSIAAAAGTAGLDMARARADLADPRLDAAIDGNLALAQRLGVNGTPSWIIGNVMLNGAVGADELARAIAAATRGRAEQS